MVLWGIILDIILLIGCGSSNAVNVSPISSMQSSCSSVVSVSSSSVSKINGWYTPSLDTLTNTVTVKYNIRNDGDSNFIYIKSITCQARGIYSNRLDATIKNEYGDPFIFPHKVMSGIVVADVYSKETPRMVLCIIEVAEFDDRIFTHDLLMML